MLGARFLDGVFWIMALTVTGEFSHSGGVSSQIRTALPDLLGVQALRRRAEPHTVQ